MEKQMRLVFTSFMVLALGFTVAACGNNGTVKQNTMDTNRDVNRLAVKTKENTYRVLDRTENTVERGLNKTENVIEKGINNTKEALDNDDMDLRSNKRNTMGNRMDPTDTRAKGTDSLEGADQLANVARQVGGVKEATVVLHEKEAIVGIDVDNMGKKNIIEKQVYNVLKTQYPEFNIHVTSQQDVHQKIKSLNTNLSKGHPIKSLANDIALIVRDIGNTVTAPIR